MSEHLPGFTLPERYGALAGREAYQCQVCRGIFYPESPNDPCPYCNEDEDGD